MAGQQAQNHRIEKAGEEILFRGLVTNHGRDRCRQLVHDQLGAAMKLDTNRLRTATHGDIENDRALDAVDSLVFTGTPEVIDLETASTNQVPPSRRLVPVRQTGQMPPPLSLAKKADRY